ncbi:MAG: hypothetical protein AB8H03_00120 [Saprospiraceae bacterium]
MKQVNRINQFLLKHYPLIWNTKLVWLVLAGMFFHILFFGAGFFSLNNPVALQARNVESNFFENGPIFFNMLISTLLIVGWLFFMFKNNSFKDFYPTSRSQLFCHFMLYFIIIIFSISFYYSYFYGMKASVKLNHPSLIVEKDIDLSNQAAPFFSHYLDQYEIDNKLYPEYFSDLLCETKTGLINFEKPHFSFLNEDYQFYTLKKVEENLHTGDPNVDPPVFTERLNDSIYIYYYKDTVIDVSKDIATANPSYYNFSEVFFNKYEVYRYSYNYYTEPSRGRKFAKDSVQTELVQFYNTLLTNNNESEIKRVLNDFLVVANKYKVATNLTTENWFSLINTDSFLLRNLIQRDAPRINYKYQEWDRKNKNRNTNSYDTNGNRIKTVRDEFIAQLETDFYLESDKLENVFSNIKSIKRKNPFEDSIHFFMWFSFFLASLVFIFRTSGLKSLIFSAITVGLLCVLLALVAIAYESSLRSISGSVKIENFMAVFTWIIGTAILVVPIFYLKKVSKVITSICINISISFFALYVFLILAIISMIQDYNCDLKYPYSSYTFKAKHCNNILRDIEIYWSYILFVVAFIFIYFFAGIIRKWRALPESK